MKVAGGWALLPVNGSRHSGVRLQRRMVVHVDGSRRMVRDSGNSEE